jgi:hypothetical protein
MLRHGVLAPACYDQKKEETAAPPVSNHKERSVAFSSTRHRNIPVHQLLDTEVSHRFPNVTTLLEYCILSPLSVTAYSYAVSESADVLGR